MGRIIRSVRDERGIETLEWILIGGLITAIGLVVYPGNLRAELISIITAIGSTITSAAGS